jgi:hypothetical protein
MNRRKSLLTVCLLVGTLALAFVMQPYSKSNATQSGRTVQPTDRGIPEHVPYMFFFDQHKFNLQKAAELEKSGKDGSKFRGRFKRLAALSDEEALILDQVTSDCEQELAQQDAKAQAVIDSYRARYPAGELPEGVTLPPPPPELTVMQQERDSIILRARDRLRSMFGEQEFTRFDKFVRERGSSSIRRAN